MLREITSRAQQRNIGNVVAAALRQGSDVVGVVFGWPFLVTYSNLATRALSALLNKQIRQILGRVSALSAPLTRSSSLSPGIKALHELWIFSLAFVIPLSCSGSIHLSVFCLVLIMLFAGLFYVPVASFFRFSAQLDSVGGSSFSFKNSTAFSVAFSVAFVALLIFIGFSVLFSLGSNFNFVSVIRGTVLSLGLFRIGITSGAVLLVALCLVPLMITLILCLSIIYLCWHRGSSGTSQCASGTPAHRTTFGSRDRGWSVLAFRSLGFCS